MPKLKYRAWLWLGRICERWRWFEGAAKCRTNARRVEQRAWLKTQKSRRHELLSKIKDGGRPVTVSLSDARDAGPVSYTSFEVSAGWTEKPSDYMDAPEWKMEHHPDDNPSPSRSSNFQIALQNARRK